MKKMKEMPLRWGVQAHIYSPVEETMTVGSNRLQVGPRLILIGVGGILQKLVDQVGSATPLRSSVFWILPESDNDIFRRG